MSAKHLFFLGPSNGPKIHHNFSALPQIEHAIWWMSPDQKEECCPSTKTTLHHASFSRWLMQDWVRKEDAIWAGKGRKKKNFEKKVSTLYTSFKVCVLSLNLTALLRCPTISKRTPPVRALGDYLFILALQKSPSLFVCWHVLIHRAIVEFHRVWQVSVACKQGLSSEPCAESCY